MLTSGSLASSDSRWAAEFKEVDSHLRLLLPAGAVNPSVAQAALDAFDSVRAMTWRLLNPTR